MSLNGRKPAPIVTANGAAQHQWRSLLEAGVVTGALENRVQELIPPPGTPVLESKIRADRTGGIALGPTFIARFEKRRRPGSGRREWCIVSVEHRRRS
jgi:hypothetical protein